MPIRSCAGYLCRGQGVTVAVGEGVDVAVTEDVGVGVAETDDVGVDVAVTELVRVPVLESVWLTTLRMQKTSDSRRVSARAPTGRDGIVGGAHALKKRGRE